MTQTARFTKIVQEAGYRSLGDWAVKNGFLRTNVYRTVRFWGGREKRPLGGINRQIMSKLRELDNTHDA